MKQDRIVGLTFVGLLLIILLAGCSTAPGEAGSDYSGETSALSSVIALPEWVMTPPAEDGYFFGIGSDSDLTEARKKSIVNIGQQFGSRVRTVLQEKQIVGENEMESVVASVDKQLTDSEVVGAKFADQFQDAEGKHWVLTRAPLDCILDVTESVLMSYRLELQQASVDSVSTIMDEVDRIMNTEVSSYYIPPAEMSAADRSGVSVVPPAMIDTDGRGDDWTSVATLINDPVGDKKGDVEGTDIESVSLAHDGTSLYVRMELADGRPRKRNLYYAVGMKQLGGSWERLLFTVYDGGWSTGVDEWTDSTGHHRQVASGRVKHRSGVIEAEYKLSDLDIPEGAAIEINAWCDPGGPAYDSTNSKVVSLSSQENYFVYKGRIHGHQVNRISTDPIVSRKSDTHRSLTQVFSVEDLFIDQEGKYIKVDLRFDPGVLKIGRNRLDNKPEGEGGYFIGSTYIEEVTGYWGNFAEGMIVLYSYDGNRAVGHFSLTSNDEKSTLEGLFNVAVY